MSQEDHSSDEHHTTHTISSHHSLPHSAHSHQSLRYNISYHMRQNLFTCKKSVFQICSVFLFAVIPRPLILLRQM